VIKAFFNERVEYSSLKMDLGAVLLNESGVLNILNIYVLPFNK